MPPNAKRVNRTIEGGSSARKLARSKALRRRGRKRGAPSGCTSLPVRMSCRKHCRCFRSSDGMVPISSTEIDINNFSMIGERTEPHVRNLTVKYAAVCQIRVDPDAVSPKLFRSTFVYKYLVRLQVLLYSQLARQENEPWRTTLCQCDGYIRAPYEWTVLQAVEVTRRATSKTI